MRKFLPDVVVLELCKSRTNILSLDEATLLSESENLNMNKVVSKWTGKYPRKSIKLVNFIWKTYSLDFFWILWPWMGISKKKIRQIIMLSDFLANFDELLRQTQSNVFPTFQKISFKVFYKRKILRLKI